MDELDSVTENELEMFFEINHENIVRYFDHFHLEIGDDSQTFLITEYCEVSKWDIFFHYRIQSIYLLRIERRFEEQNRMD